MREYRDFKKLHDPRQELPRQDGLAVLYVLKFMITSLFNDGLK